MTKIISLLCACLMLCSLSYAREHTKVTENTNYTQTSELSKSDLQNIMEAFCRNFYSDCFTGRRYAHNSLKITDVSYPSSQTVRVEGTHTYYGRFGIEYSSYRFYALIRTYSREVEITFYKRSAPDLWHSDYYWESCSKTFPLN